MPTAQRYKSFLQSYLEEGGPNTNGEWGMHCPLHEDKRRSASVNFERGLWYCNACDYGGPVRDLVKQLERDGQNGNSTNDNNGTGKKVADLPSEEQISAWHTALMFSSDRLGVLCKRRGLTKLTLRRWQIGWDAGRKAYTIPIRDIAGELVNVRFYRFDPPGGRRKIWSLEGHGTPTLFPLEVLDDSDDVVVCEGEWDALLTIQKGFTAVTRTGSAKTWDTFWNRYFQDKDVYLIHDMDRDGQAANHKIMDRLAAVAAEVHIVKLPYEVLEDHGKDLTDFWLEPHNLGDFIDLLNGSLGDLQVVNDDAVPVNAVNVLNSFDSAYVGQPLRMRVTITGKRTPTSVVPEEIVYTCTQDAGPKCMVCPMRGFNGVHQARVEASDALILEMLGSTNQQLTELLRQYINAQKCTQLDIDVVEHRSVEELFVRPSVELSRVQYGETSDFTHRKIISVGRHDSLPNNTVEIVGTIYPNPRGQQNEFQAWEVTKTETSIDKFEITDSVRRVLDLFKPRAGQRPIGKLGEIAKDLATHVTKIYGRTDVHAVMDLVWHSAMSFYFGDVQVHRGWLEALLVGDTRTGKSEIANRMIQHYGAGEYVSCESASFAGIVGGLQQLGSGREWEVTWGAIPINDRRLVVLDEVSGLSLESIQSMSSIRSSGEAQLTKIRAERTWARTRLIWLGNPREARMDSYTYGVQAIKPLIGNNEDIARFDLAMSLRSSDVAIEDINRDHQAIRNHVYTQAACEVAVMWAWSRRPEHISFTDEATQLIYEMSIELGQRYVEDPPLVQAANIRIKLARLAVAFAIRTVSTDASYEEVIVRRQHVEDSVAMIDKLYGTSGFGYKDFSEERIQDTRTAEKNRDVCKSWLAASKGLAKFLRSMGHFRKQDMEDMLNYSKEEANSKINKLWDWRMLSRDGQNIGIQPVLHDILREVEE